MTDQAHSWHALRVHETAAALDTDHDAGLTAEDASRRLERYGPNKLPEGTRRGPLQRLIAQFNNVLIYVLVGAAVVAALLGEHVDAAVIAAVVVINALIGYIQEGKAEKAIDAIRSMLSLEAVVRRDGARRTIPAEELVPGDVVYLKAGDKVPADLRVLRSDSLQAQEAPLTGESTPIDKAADPVAAESVLGDRFSMLYSGTLVTYGAGRGIVVATGSKTELGRISGLMEDDRAITTPLLQQMDVFGRWLTVAILAMAGFTLAFGLTFRDYSVNEMFMAAVGVAVAAIPEGLPAIMTITLAIGVTRMARRNAIIRRLPAVETLGAVSVICSDKTGTLTHNELMVRAVLTPAGRYAVQGEGYAPEGSLHRDSAEGAAVDPADAADLVALAQAAVLCNDAEIRREVAGGWVLTGNPTDGALLAFGAKAGFDPDGHRAAIPAEATIPFDSAHKFMATAHHLPDGRRVAFVKGAPERILEMCDNVRQADGSAAPLDRDAWSTLAEELAAQGQRLIGVAVRPLAEGEALDFDRVAGGLTLLGLLGLIDPPRQDAIAAVAQCRRAGITVKMITGDHAVTAAAIAADIGIGAERRDATGRAGALTGRQLDALDREALPDAAADIDVFARTTPENKLQLVEALQQRGHVVAMTGDGVNDAPALKRADVGIAMGIKGTEAAKEASEMVLADDNFASIARAVEEGRTVYDNLKKAIVFVLPTSFGQAMVVLAAILAGMILPITPVQILWVNMVTAVTLSLALAFESPEKGVMTRPPRGRDEPIVSGFLIWRIVLVSVLLLIGAFGLFAWQRSLGVELEVARTVAVNSLVIGQVVYLINSRHILEPSWTLEGLFGSRLCLGGIAAVLVFQMLLTYAPFMQFLFGTGALTLDQWLWIGGFGIALFVLVELEKALFRRLRLAH